MDINLLKKIVKIFEESSITELEIEEENTRIRISKDQGGYMMPQGQFQPVMPQMGAQSSPAASAPAEVPAAKKEEAKGNFHEVKSPIVGTFYRAPAPDSDSYVKVGDTVSAGTTLCIVEAMKLMNEIESDVAGKIVKILVENGKPVEYNQPLFLIEL